MANDYPQELKQPCVLLTGASGQIGVFAIPRLVAAGFRVLAVSRKGRPSNYPLLAEVDWLFPEEAERDCGKCQYLLSAGPVELAENFLKIGHQFLTAVVFSSSSVISKRKSPNPTERVQINNLLDLETRLELIAAERNLKMVIFRPTLIYGCGLDLNITRLAKWADRLGVIPVNRRANGLRQPVHADDLASVAVAAMTSEEPLPGKMNLAGGSTLSYLNMIEGVFAALNKPPRTLRIPQSLLSLLVAVLNATGLATGINREMVARQAVDLVFDDQQARQLLEYKPRPFAPSIADLSLPEPVLLKALATSDQTCN